MSGPDYAARAAAGAVFLDGQVPGWAGKIELATLDLSSECRCVLGQQHAGGYSGMRDALGLTGSAAVQLGFSLGPDDDLEGWEDWAELDAAWAREIVTRREAAQAQAAEVTR